MHTYTPFFLAALVSSAAANYIPYSSWTSNSTTLPQPSKTTQVLTTFATTTVCPVTTTRYHHSSVEIITTYTTSTLTVTSCKYGCQTDSTTLPISNTTWGPTPTKATHTPHTGGPWLTTVYPTTVVTTYTKFVPCSTPIATSSGTTYYSTWLTPTFIPSSYISTCTDSYALTPPIATPVVPVQPVTPVSPVNTCAPPKTITITKTITSSPSIPTPPLTGCKSCYEAHTLTLTNGQTSIITITHTKPPHKPTTSTKATQPTGTGSPSKPTGTGGYPQGTGNLEWHKPSVSPKAW
jgi:hypothetical protein